MNKQPRYFIFPTDIVNGVPPQFRDKLTDTLLKNATDGFDVIIDLQEKKMIHYMNEWEKVEWRE